MLALALAGVALHGQGTMSGLVLAGAAMLALLALLTDGPLGITDLVSRRAHQALDLVLVALIAASPVLVWGRLGVAGTLIAEAVAIILLRVSLGTAYPVRRPAPAVVDARSTSRDDPAPAPSGPPAVRRAVERGAYLLGGAVGRTKRPPSKPVGQ